MRYLFAVLVLVLAARMASAQPVTYMIPDIGAPGMNTQVDIIAPASEFGKFLLVDGLTPPSTLTIRFLNPADSNRIRVSPGVVSWHMRMVSFQFFVKPGAALGPVPMQLEAAGQKFNLDTFHIVRPQPFGSKSGGGIIGSSATYGAGMGQRSKRGAMIVDEMILRNGVYTVDVTDRDPAVLGNQGYLPVIILSRGRIVVEPTATISVAAPAGAASKNAGPGGGGGGGYGADREPIFPIPVTIFGENDAPLGAGFTGGRSAVAVAPALSGFGQGSGMGSAGLNGVEANSQFKTSLQTIRLFGAGPGHPFDTDGRSGGAAVATANAPPNFIGTYYGGGGNATKGTGLPVAQDDYNGQIVGNIRIAPLHGGGGGSSGGSNDSVGGGGGGAIALYATLDAQVATIDARGGNGKNGCHDCGPGSGDASAGGAGGSVIIGGKIGVTATALDVRGGSAGLKALSAVPGSTSGHGGDGRFRNDGRLGGSATVLPNVSRYAGPTIDTLTYATRRSHILRGTGRYVAGAGDSILIFVRGEKSDWDFSNPFRTVVRSDSTWQAAITFPDDTLAYLFALQITPQQELAAVTPATRIPTHIFSQSAANIIRLQLRNPQIDAPTLRRLDTLRCPTMLFDTFSVRNLGVAPLIIDGGSGFLRSATSRFSIIEPKLPDTLEPGEARRWIVLFDGWSIPNGTYADTLRIISNDPATPRFDVPFTILREVANLEVTPPVALFGNVQIGSSARRTLVVRNPSSSSFRHNVTELAFTPSNPQVKLIWPTIPPDRALDPGDTFHIVLEYTPTGTQDLNGIYLYAHDMQPCDDRIPIPMNGRGVRASLIVSRDLLTLIDSNCALATPAEDTLTLINTGTQPVTVSALAAIPADLFTIVSPPPGFQIPAGGSRQVRVRYTPRRAGDTTGTLTVTSSDPERPSFTVALIGARDSTMVESSTQLLEFRNMLSCETAIDTVFELVNTGLDTVTIFPVNITPPFEIRDPPPYVLAPGERKRITVRFAPVSDGAFSSLITYTANPCNLVDLIEVRGERVPSSYTITDVAFGDVTVGGSSTAATTIRNNNSVPIRISGARFIPTLPELTVEPGQFPLRIPAGGQGDIIFRFAPTIAGDIPNGIRIEVDIDSVCNEKLGAAVTGRGIPGGVALDRSSLSFGTLLDCQTAEDTVTLINVGKSPVAVSGPSLIPAAASANFSIVGGTYAPGSLQPGDSATVIVRFTPDAGPDGPRSAILRFTTDDPLRPQVDLLLAGDQAAVSLAFAGPGFGQVGGGNAANATHWIVNTGTAPVTIDAAAIPSPFSVISTTPPLPATLAPGDSLSLDLRFAPPAPGDFSDTLRVTPRFVCDSIRFPLAATAIDLSVIAAAATWEDVSGAPGDLIRIPLRIDNDLTVASVTLYTASARFNRTMLQPLKIVLTGTLSDGWILTLEKLEPGRIEFSAQGSAPLAGPGILAYLEARVLLGDSTVTPVSGGDTTGTNSARASLSIASGLFTLRDYCTVGGDRLLRVSGTAGIKSVRPNPTTGNAEVEIAVVESVTRLILYDALGRRVATLFDGPIAPRTYIVTLPAADLPAGVYYLERSTPTERERVRMIVVR